MLAVVPDDRADRAAHEDAQAYWRGASATFVADGGYYELVADALVRHVFPLVPADASVLDVGCGEGTYTELLASVSGRVEAFDLSPALIEAARARSLPNVDFVVGDASTAEPGSFDVVSCMGVLVCLVDDEVFADTLDTVCGAVRPGGLLLLRETLSGWGRRVVRDDSYVACYRPLAAYLGRLGDFDLVLDERLARWSRRHRRTNHLLVLRRRAVDDRG